MFDGGGIFGGGGIIVFGLGGLNWELGTPLIIGGGPIIPLAGPDNPGGAIIKLCYPIGGPIGRGAPLLIGAILPIWFCIPG